MKKNADETRGETMCAWIKARLAEGQTVYVQTSARTWVLKPKHADLVRLHNGNCQLARGKKWDVIDWTKVTARYDNPATRSAAPLPPDWPQRFARYVKDEAAHYVSAQRGDWPDSEALLQQSIDRVAKKIEADSDRIDDAADEWVDRWESGDLDDEIKAAIDYYSSKALGALESNPALPPFEPVEVEQIRADMQAAIGAVAERHGLRVQYSELAPTEKVIPVGFKIYRRAPEQRDLFGNPGATRAREANPRTTRIGRRISST